MSDSRFQTFDELSEKIADAFRKWIEDNAYKLNEKAKELEDGRE